MKKTLYSFIIGTIILFSCSERPSQEIKVEGVAHASVIKQDDPIFDILFDPEGYTFEDLHAYYLIVKSTRSHEANYDNVRRKIMAHMKLDKTLVNHVDKKIIEFYANEILGMDYISDMHLLALLLTKLKGHWKIEKIRSTAEASYMRNMKYILEHFPDPNIVLDKQKFGASRLRKISLLKE